MLLLFVLAVVNSSISAPSELSLSRAEWPLLKGGGLPEEPRISRVPAPACPFIYATRLDTDVEDRLEDAPLRRSNWEPLRE